MTKMIVYNGYPLSLVVAITMHSLMLAALVFWQRESSSEVFDITQPAIVKAILLDENPQLRNERLLDEQRLIRLDQQRLEREAEAQRQAEAEAARQEAEAEAARQEQEREAAAERERQAQLQRERDATALRERLERERQDEEMARQQQEERELQRQRELAAEQERQRQAAAQAAAADIARTEYEMVQAYTGIIHDLVQQNWSRPPSARNGMVAVFRMRLVPTGDVLDVELVQGSGDAAFDRAAETAIHRVGRFTELQGMPTSMFNQNFRTLLLTFRPEDLLN